MKKVTFRYLSQEEVIKTHVPYERVIELIESAMASKGRDMVECPPKPGVHTRKNTFLHAMPAYIVDKDVCGMKWVSGYPENYKHDLPQIAGLIIYNSEETGMPLAVMDCRWITGVRTAAVSAVTAKYCKPEKAETLSIIGTGIQGRMHALMLKIVAPEIRHINICDVREEAVQSFIADMKDKIDAEIVIAKDAETAVRQADILVTATQRLDKPIVMREWLKKGMLGIGLEASRAWDGKAILNTDRYITDDWELTKSYQAQGAFPDGLPEAHSTLGKIVIGQEPGRERADDIILAINEGMAISDVILAKEVFERAEKQGIGTILPLMESENILL